MNFQGSNKDELFHIGESLPFGAQTTIQLGDFYGSLTVQPQIININYPISAPVEPVEPSKLSKQEWGSNLEASALDLASDLQKLEQNIPAHELREWLEAFDDIS